MWCDNLVDLFRLATLVQNDILPEEEADAAYLFGHTKQCEEPILETGAALFKSRVVRGLYVCRLAAGYPYNGPKDNPTYRDFYAWQRELMALGVPSDDIYPIDSPLQTSPEEKFPVSHTGTEAERLVLLARDCGWASIFVVSHPMHLLRAFTQTVGFVLKEYPALSVYARTIPPNSWHAHATLNQGVASGAPFMEGIDQEWKRLNAVYGNKYDPIPASRVIEYINWREAQGD
ncbi:MAG: hypothetical protein HY434_00755 [Candidatus Liptonbacteria bacterium]|nr:hypothetical protein [Parcubacteria group bacterium]MBI4087346.1 hypothetical protein [Candidatus Liptonbacteria bacterium]